MLASSGARQVAFEVQVSHQPRDEYRRQQDRYREAKVRCAWFVRHEASITSATPDLPVFPLVESEDGLQTVVSGHTLRLQDAAAQLLQGAVRFRGHVSNGSAVDIGVVVHPSDPCWKCKKTYPLWKVLAASAEGACGMRVTQDIHGYSRWSEEKPEAERDVVRAVATAVNGSPLRPARISMRYSRTTKTKYMAFSCPHCGALVGDHFLFSFWSEAIYSEPAFTLTVTGGVDGMVQPHWCLDTGRGHCLTRPLPTSPVYAGATS